MANQASLRYRCCGTHGCTFESDAASVLHHCISLGHGRPNNSAKFSAARSRVDDFDASKPLALQCCRHARKISPKTLKKHVLQAHRNDLLPFGCQACTKRAKTWTNARSHVLLHAPLDIACGSKCRQCGKWCANSHLLRAHGSTRGKQSTPCNVGHIDTILLDHWIRVAQQHIPFDSAQDLNLPNSVCRRRNRRVPSRRDDDNPTESDHVIPSAIVCSCGDRFDNNNAPPRSALCLYLAHKSSAIASFSMSIQPHRVVGTFVSCTLCKQSLDVDHYRAHLAKCRRLANDDKYRRNRSTQFGVSPFFCCAACIDEDERFHRLDDVGTILEHSHGSGVMELYVTCRVCASDVAVDNALEHAAFAHRERLESTAAADMFDTGGATGSTLSRSVDAGNLNNALSSFKHDETPDFAPDHHHQMLEAHQRPVASIWRSAKRVPSADSLVDHQSRVTFVLPDTHYPPEQISSKQLVDALCEVGAEPTSTLPLSGSNLTDVMPIETAIPCEVSMQCLRQATSTAAPGEFVRKRVFECDACGQRFVTRHSLTTHQCMRTGELIKKEVLLHECDNCGRRYSTAWDLQLHGKSHTVESPSARKFIFECDECGITFSRGDVLRRHQRSHAGVRDIFSCDSGEVKFTCSHSGKCFNHLRNLTRHRRNHTDERPYACSDCGLCFTEAGNLRRHRRLHTAERPFGCSDCGKRFTQSGYLKAHRVVHADKNPFACPDCGKCFARSGHLSVHRSVHTGERSYACSDCGKRFTHSSNLSQHSCLHTS